MTTMITIAYGDGKSPELLEAILYIFREAALPLAIETIEIGKRIYGMDYPPGILPSAFDILDRNRTLLKGITVAPSKKGYKDVTEVICERYGLTPEHLVLSQKDQAKAYISDHFALFEFTEETPESALEAAIRMLEHIGLPEEAHTIKTALQKIQGEGLPEKTLFQRAFHSGKSPVMEFAEAICAALNSNYSQIAS